MIDHLSATSIRNCHPGLIRRTVKEAGYNSPRALVQVGVDALEVVVDRLDPPQAHAGVAGEAGQLAAEALDVAGLDDHGAVLEAHRLDESGDEEVGAADEVPQAHQRDDRDQPRDDPARAEVRRSER